MKEKRLIIIRRYNVVGLAISILAIFGLPIIFILWLFGVVDWRAIVSFVVLIPFLSLIAYWCFKITDGLEAKEETKQ